MKHPLCQGNKCQGQEVIARWVIRIRSRFQFETLRAFACHDCRNDVERKLTDKGQELGLNQILVDQIR